MAGFDLVRELWLRRTLRASKTAQGAPPLSFTAKAGRLRNYRIFGNTVNAASVGDRTANLFDGYAEIGSFDLQGADVNNKDALSMCRTGYINVLPDTTYTISLNGDYVIRHVGYYGGNFTFIGSLSVSVCTFTTPSATNQIRIVFKTVSGDSANVDDFTNIPIMLNEGSTALPYEPYGYRVPVTVTNGTNTETTNIYLDEPLGKSGDDTDYIDYKTQKRYNIDGTSEDVTLPGITVPAGTDTLSVGTTVQPSKVKIKYKKG